MKAIERKVAIVYDSEARGGKTVIKKNLFSSRFIQTNIQSQRIACGIGDSQMLEYGRDIPFPART
jgi:hypothetical protein